MKPSHRFAIESLESRQLMAAITVLNTADSGAGSLRDAIASANTGDTIDLSGITGTITLQSTLTIDKSLTLQGPQPGSLTIDGDSSVQLLHINASGATINLNDLTFTHGSAVTGGAIQIDASATTNITRCTFADNQAVSDSVDVYGGAIYSNGGALNVIDSTFTNNEANGISSVSAIGGAIISRSNTLTVSGSTFNGNSTTAGEADGGAIMTYTNLVLSNDTFTMNNVTDSTSNALGGAIMIQGDATVTNCTIVNNTATGNCYGGGILAEGMFNTLTLNNTIIAGNSAGTGADVTNWSFGQGSNNLIGDGNESQLVNGTDGNLVGTTASPIDPMLNALASNGGPTQTMSLQAGSPAIDAGNDANAPTTDQRGDARVGFSDIGAFEYSVAPAPVETSGITVADGVLTIAGRSTANDIHAWTRNGGDQFRVVFNGDIKNYDATTLTSIVINGSDGDDHILINTGNVPASIFGGAGNDTLLGGDEADTLVGGDGNDYLSSGAGNDALYGEAGNDNLFGGDGNDLLFGGDGNDTLRGEAGNDTIRGEAGTNSIFAKNGTADIIRTASLLDTFKLDAIDKLFTIAA